MVIAPIRALSLYDIGLGLSLDTSGLDLRLWCVPALSLDDIGLGLSRGTSGLGLETFVCQP